MKFQLIALAAAAVLVGSTAGAEAPAGGAQSAQASAEDGHPQTPTQNPNTVICKREEITGSRFMKKVCLTRAEWGAKQAAAEKFKTDVEERGSIASMPANNAP